MSTSFLRTGVAALALACLSAGLAGAAETVTLSSVHLCCKGCTMTVEKAAAKVPGVACTTNQDEQSVALTADSFETIQKAIDEIGKAGLIGTPDSDKVKVTLAKAPEGKVAKLEITNIHNCCGPCNDAITAAVEGVEGVTSNTAKAKKSTFVVEGDFVATDLLQALVDAGFYGSTEPVEEKK